MKNQFIRIILACILLMGFMNNITSQTSEKIFQDGLQKEIGEGELLEAIDIYNSILFDESASRNMKAKAMLHIGFCYQKLGNNEASEIYQQIIKDFGEQKEIVEIAQSRLNRLISTLNEPDFPKGIMLQQIWVGSDVDIGGSVSPDGKYISFWDHESGNLGYKDLVQDKIRLLTDEGTYEKPMLFTINSTISPDGKKIAYSWYNLNGKYEVRVLDIDNPIPTILYSKIDEDVFPISWFPDSKKMLIRGFSDSSGCRIISLDLLTKDFKILKRLDDGCIGRTYYSPDGRFVAYDMPVSRDGGNYDVCLLSTEGKEEIKLIEHPANDRLLAWTPESSDLIFISDRSGTWDAWVQPLINGIASGNPKRFLPGIGYVNPLGYANFDALYYGVFSRKHTSSIVPLNNLHMPDFSMSKPLLGSKYAVEFSPEGNHTSYINELIEPHGWGWYYRPLHVLNRETGIDRVMVKHLAVRYPRWSNDGSTIIFMGYDEALSELPEYNGGIYQLNLHSEEVKELVRLPKPISDSLCGWAQCVVEPSMDDQSIFYVNGSGIVNRNLISEQERYLIKEKRLLSVLDRSPTENSLLFATGPDQSNKGKLYILSIASGDIMEICSAQSAEQIQSAVWSTDGNFVFFSENTDSGMELWRVPARGGAPERLLESEYKNACLGIDITDNTLVISNFMEEAEVWRMQNIMSAIAGKK